MIALKGYKSTLFSLYSFRWSGPDLTGNFIDNDPFQDLFEDVPKQEPQEREPLPLLQSTFVEYYDQTNSYPLQSGICSNLGVFPLQ